MSDTLILTAARTCGAVRHLTLAATDGAALASFTPGSHILVEAGPQVNAYSLTGEFSDPQTYEISVLAAQGGMGSRWLHDDFEVGDAIGVSPAVSAFAPVSRAQHHVLIAGGIGITPILSHARAAVRYGRSFEAIYSHRADQPAHLDELAALCDGQLSTGGRLSTVHDRRELLTLLRSRLNRQPLDSMLYVCGPAGLLASVTELGASLGWPAGRILSEAFGLGSLDPGEPFTATLRRSGRQIRVRSGVSLLEALESAGVTVPSLCRQGVCGECRVPVTAGRPQHRDLYLSESERQAGDCVMACVSRAEDDELELAL